MLYEQVRSMRVPQAISTNRALALTGDGTTAVSARSALPCRRSLELPTVSPWRISTMRRRRDMASPGSLCEGCEDRVPKTLRQSAR